MNPITWQAPEFIKHEKPKRWYLALWIVAAGLVVVGVVTASIFMVVLVVIAALLVSLYGAKNPRTLSFVLTEQSLTIENREYPLEDFASFWIFSDRKWHTFSLNHKKRTKQHTEVLIPADLSRQVRQMAIGVLPEEEQSTSLIEELADRLRF